MNETTYNGWTNYETWLVNMFFDGNYTGQGDYEYYHEMAAEHFDREDDDKGAYGLSNALEESLDQLLEDTVGENLSMIFGDLLRRSLGNVNWYEIAKSMLEEVSEEME